MIAVNKTQFSFFCSAYLGSVLPNSLGWFVGWHHRRILRFYYLIENVLRGLFSNNLAYLTSQHRSNQSLTEFNLLSVTCKWPSFLSSTIVLLKHSISWSLNSSFGTHGFQNGAKESKLRKIPRKHRSEHLFSSRIPQNLNSENSSKTNSRNRIPPTTVVQNTGSLLDTVVSPHFILTVHQEFAAVFLKLHKVIQLQRFNQHEAQFAINVLSAQVHKY